MNFAQTQLRFQTANKLPWDSRHNLWLARLELSAGGYQRTAFDLHSGSFGGIIYNPAQVLVDILQKLKNPDGTVALPGFYDEVLAPENYEREEMASFNVDIESLKDYLGVSELTGEPGYSLLERRTARPTLDINGLWGGFSGEGAKTIVPAKAGAKVSMRLVPNQVPEKIDQLFHQFVTANCPRGVSAKITSLHGAEPVLVSRKTPAMLAAKKAIATGFGKEPVFIREGGSIPVVNLINISNSRTSFSWAGEAPTTRCSFSQRTILHQRFLSRNPLGSRPFP